MNNLLRIDTKKLSGLFDKLVDTVVSIEGEHLDEWNLVCKGSTKQRKDWYLLNKFACLENYYTYECLDAWNNQESMYKDIGDEDSLYLDVIEIVTGKSLPKTKEVVG
jgi:hypothetical protein